MAPGRRGQTHVPDRTGSYRRRGYIGRNTTSREQEVITPKVKKTIVT